LVILLILPFILFILFVLVFSALSKSPVFFLKLGQSSFNHDTSPLINITFPSRIAKLSPIAAAPDSNADISICRPATSVYKPPTPDSNADTCPCIPYILSSIAFILPSVSLNRVLVVSSNLVTLDFTSETSV
jgi:hypothetical protein